DTRVGEIDFAPKQQAVAHVNAFLVEAVAQGLVTKKQIRQCADNARTRQHGANQVVSPQRTMRSFEGHYSSIKSWRAHAPILAQSTRSARSLDAANLPRGE